jgi:hypothetical protein
MIRGFRQHRSLRRTFLGMVATRPYTTDSYHNYLNDTPVKQTQNVDPIYRVKAEQQAWLDTNQWVGYSDTYLAKNMRYLPTTEGSVGIGYYTPILDRILELVFHKYGDAADILEELEADPLKTDFHHKIIEAQEKAAELEDGIDDLYAALHPTYKTVADAYLARRHYVCGIAQSHIRSLERVGKAFDNDPVFYLTQAGLNEEELEIVRQKAKFHKQFRKFGSSASYGDYNPL